MVRSAPWILLVFFSFSSIVYSAETGTPKIEWRTKLERLQEGLSYSSEIKKEVLEDLKDFNPEKFGKFSLLATKWRQAATNDPTARNALLSATCVPIFASCLPSALNSCYTFISLGGETLSVNLAAIGNSLQGATNLLKACRGSYEAFKNGTFWSAKEINAFVKRCNAISCHATSAAAAIYCAGGFHAFAIYWALMTVYYALPRDNTQVVLTSCQENYLLDYLTDDEERVSQKRMLINDMINKYVACVKNGEEHEHRD